MKNVIYQIVNLVTGVRYIGQAVCSETRRKTHFYKLRKNIHDNVFLQLAYNKHGKQVFEYEIIDQVPYAEELEFRERYWFDKYDFETELYNIAEDTFAPMLGRKHKKSTRRKISEAHKGKTLSEEHKNNLSLSHMNKTLSEEHKEKVSLALMGREVSEKTRQQIAQNQPSRRSVAQIDKDTDEIIAIYTSLSEGARATGATVSGICAVCRARKFPMAGTEYVYKTAGGFKWKYLEDIEEETNQS